MNEPKLYKCGCCKCFYIREDMARIEYGEKWVDYSKCRFCTHDEYFKFIAQNYILGKYKIYLNETPPELLQIEILRAKTRWLLRGKEPTYIRI